MEADSLEEIKELKIDGHSEKFKEWNNIVPTTASLRAHIHFINYKAYSLIIYFFSRILR